MDVIWLLDRVIAYLEAQHVIIPDAIKSLKAKHASNATIADTANQWRECNELLSQLRDFRGQVALDRDELDEERLKRH